MSAQLAQALRRLIAELPVRVTNDQQLIHLSAAHIEGIGQACVKALQAIEAAPQQEPDCWAILTPNGSRLVSPDEAKGRKGAYPLFAAPQQEPVAEVYRAHPGGRSRNIGLNDVRPLRGATLPPPGTKLYAAPQQAQAPTLSGLTDETKSALWRVGADLAQAQAPIDPDGAESRAGFRAFDESQMARWATPWHVWREAVKWAAPQQGRKS